MPSKRRPPKAPKPPKGLKGDARKWFLEMCTAFDFADDPAGLELLRAAAVQLLRIEQARAAIGRDGVVVEDRFGKPREHPAAVTERAATNTFRLLIRELGLQSVAEEAPRLPRIAGRYA